ncbi:hypothetical protein [Floricoccus penangensis]|uniref:hypothetical protein n=1 Tax=Floricoccus penangensis TaxID=1859475 RepID=UPI0013017830|nr:hypothetical protein [Floricoccus penangensis]
MNEMYGIFKDNELVKSFESIYEVADYIEENIGSDEFTKNYKLMCVAESNGEILFVGKF